ncbi:MAG TPA: hypothetical protein VMT82_03325 [candidate division Zixibacteria bacterium]|nr:hypothetical protein [candidate division Zixibacteria bacterium]
MKKVAISEVLAVVNLVLVCVLYRHIGDSIANAIQFVIIPVLILATVVFSVRDLSHSGTRFHALVALVLSIPVVFIYFVWRGWIAP